MNSSLNLNELVAGQLYILQLNSHPDYSYLARYSGVNLSGTLNFAIYHVFYDDSWHRFTDEDDTGVTSRLPRLRFYLPDEMNKNNPSGYRVFPLDFLGQFDVPDDIPKFVAPIGGKRKSMRKSKRRKSKRKSKRRKSGRR